MVAERTKVQNIRVSMHMGEGSQAAKRGGDKGEHEETNSGTTLDVENQQKRKSLADRSEEPCGAPAGLNFNLPKPAYSKKPFKDVKHALYMILSSVMMPIPKTSEENANY